VDSSRSAHDLWLKGGERSFDVALYVYRGELEDDRVDYIAHRKGFKFENLYDFSVHCDLLQYEAVWVVDDDIQMQTAEIDRMFEIFSRNRLQIAQPAYAKESHTSWELCFVDEAYHLRFSNFCENGVVVFSRNALRKCLPVMKDLKTGWGSEYLFYKLIGEPERGVAIIDDVLCYHPHHESTLDQVIPRRFHGSELAFLMDKYRYKIYVPRILGGERRTDEQHL
jgi:hypothetical protein